VSTFLITTPSPPCFRIQLGCPCSKCLTCIDCRTPPPLYSCIFSQKTVNPWYTPFVPTSLTERPHGVLLRRSLHIQISHFSLGPADRSLVQKPYLVAVRLSLGLLFSTFPIESFFAVYGFLFPRHFTNLCGASFFLFLQLSSGRHSLVRNDRIGRLFSV